MLLTPNDMTGSWTLLWFDNNLAQPGRQEQAFQRTMADNNEATRSARTLRVSD